MKKLVGKHIFLMAKIVKTANLKEELGEILAKIKPSKDGEESLSVEQVGIEMITTIFAACGNENVEKSIYEFLNDVFEANVAEMSFEVIVSKFKQLANENNLMGFFKVVGI